MYYLKKFSTNSDVENLKMSGYTECPMVVASVENNISNILYQPDWDYQWKAEDGVLPFLDLWSYCDITESDLTENGLIVRQTKYALWKNKNMLPQSLTIQFTVDKSEDFNDGYPSHGLMWNLPSSGNSQPFHGAYIQGTKFNLCLRDVTLSLPKIEPSETVYTIRWQMDPENNNLWATTSQNKQVIVKGRKQTQYSTEFRNRAFSFHMSNNASTTGYWLLKSIKISIKE